ncbi:uncharacterized protein HD556DRAFT_19150 [Suillus plorans]|uniref:Uncharacterized protein n=1 Tax=Suillus plorans TaxID=116603 RepID=A0A9P7E303_9AGAM|nr:uncharacterized protein HD556DRAFT_19150 [Suillus plorans]KAG1809984.1 hypothetical protein HD556DRAFT_19150 [Suillus plorans]
MVTKTMHRFTWLSAGGSKPNSRSSVIAFMDHFPARFRHSPTIIAKHSSSLRAPLLAPSLAVVFVARKTLTLVLFFSNTVTVCVACCRYCVRILLTFVILKWPSVCSLGCPMSLFHVWIAKFCSQLLVFVPWFAARVALLLTYYQTFASTSGCGQCHPVVHSHSHTKTGNARLVLTFKNAFCFYSRPALNHHQFPSEDEITV